MIIKEKNYKIYCFENSIIKSISYLILIDNKAIIIDPIRIIDEYLKILKDNNCELKYILVTHLHSEYCAGHLILSKMFNIDIYMGENSEINYETKIVKENDQIKIGNFVLEFILTPGHTIESICILLKEYSSKIGIYKEKYLFTGDTLSLDNVGIPCVSYKTSESIEFMINKLYSSINKIFKLNEKIKILSYNSNKKIYNLKQISKKNNFLKPKDKYIFSSIIQKHILHPLEINNNRIIQYENHLYLIEEYMKKYKNEIKDLEEYINNNNYLIMDTRDTELFTKNHIINSINIPIEFNFINIIKKYLEYDQKIIILCDKHDLFDILNSLVLIGFNKIIGYFNLDNLNKLDSKYLDKVKMIETRNINKEDDNIEYYDLRSINETKNGFINNSNHINFININQYLNNFNNNRINYLYCKLGTRSVIAYSLLKNKGINNLKVIKGGYISLLYSGFKIIKK